MNKKVILVIVVIIVLFYWIGQESDSDTTDTTTNNPIVYNQNQTTFVNPDPNFFDVGDSATQESVSQICPVCYGSGACAICNGLGWSVGYNGEDSSCSACDDYSGGVNDSGEPYGNGRCSTCHGTGFY